MVRVSDEAELGQSDTILKYAEKVGLKSDDISKLTATFKKAKEAYSSYKKDSKPAAAPSMPPPYFAPTTTGTSIGILPIVAILAGVGIVAYAFMRK